MPQKLQYALVSASESQRLGNIVTIAIIAAFIAMAVLACEETLKPRSTRELRGAFGEL